MEPATVIHPSPPVEAHQGSPELRRRIAPPWSPPGHIVGLGALLAFSLVLRLWGIKQGLPYSYNSDEATHFVPTAVGLARAGLNPHYFVNPPAYTYLLYLVLVVRFGGGHALQTAFAHDPSAVYVVARVLSAVLGTVSVALTYVAGARLFGRSAGLLAGAILGLAFLPVFYGHLALNDSPTLAPVALTLVGVAGIVRRGRGGAGRPGGAGRLAVGGAGRPALDYAMAGLGVGLAAATKYTGGFTILCLLAAFGWDAWGREWGAPARRLMLGLAMAVVAFLVADPYAVLDHSAFVSGLSYQAGAVGTTKLGLTPSNGWIYYLWTFTWGLGWVPSLAGLAGAALLLARRRTAEAFVLLPAIVAYVLYMGDQERFFGRWLMPVFPLVALLAGFSAASALTWAARRTAAPRARLASVLAVAVLLGQGVAADIHDDRVLSRPDTRSLARGWMVRHIPAGTKVVIEPIAPAGWGSRWHQYPTSLVRLPGGQIRAIHLDQYESYLRPELVSRYAAQRYCWVLTGSQQSGRALANRAAAPGAAAYYAALTHRARLVHRVTPYAPGSQPPAFSYDWSFDYYPPQYRLPGPLIRIYRLTDGGCGSVAH